MSTGAVVALRLGKLREANQIALVRLDRARRQPLLQRDVVGEARDEEASRPALVVAHAPRGSADA